MVKGRVLVIAGSDSGGGAGIQGDVKTITSLGGYASTAITALTAQNTKTVSAIHSIPIDFINEQIKLVLTDLGADCIKIGMLNTKEVIEGVVEAIERYGKGIPIVSDTVMIAKGGAQLLADDAVESMKNLLLPMSTLITPNIPEAEVLTGRQISDFIEAGEAGKELLNYGSHAVLIKGGHLESSEIVDQLYIKGKSFKFESKRIETNNTHGTGCSLASACAIGMAQGLDIRAAVESAQKYVYEAIKTAPGFGFGFGPLNHCHTINEL